VVEEKGEIAKQSSLIGLTDSSKVTQKPAAVGDRGRGRAVQVGVDPPSPSAGEESLFNGGGLGADAKVSPHQVKKNGVDT
jgi:hypothetical protein